MKIWHIGASFSPQKVCGVNNTIWLVAIEQVKQGHQVTLILEHPPDAAALDVVANTGLKLVCIPANIWRYNGDKLRLALHSEPPDLVHLHSVFIPRLATLGKLLVKKKIPYIITPHAMSPELLQRGWLKKSIYSWLLEKPRFYAASAITVVTPKEAETVSTFVPGYRGIIRWIPNPIDVQSLSGPKWQGNLEAKQIVYLGRFDVLHKGIDILVETARAFPEAEFHLYGTEHGATQEWLERILCHLPKNVQFHAPVFGAIKNQVLFNASLYIQMSRWEVFGLSIAEAMYLGVPCAVAETVNLAKVFQEHDIGLVLPLNPQAAASCLREMFAQPQRLRQWGSAAQTFTEKYFQPQAVALDYLKLYQEIVSV